MPALFVYADKIAQRIYDHVSSAVKYSFIQIYSVDGKIYAVKHTVSTNVSGNTITVTWTGIEDSSNAYTIDRIEVTTYIGGLGGKIVIKPDTTISKSLTEILELTFTLTVSVG